MKKYIFSGLGCNVDNVRSHKVYIQGELSLNELNHLLYDLYEQTCMKPEYIFLCQQDLETISKELRRAMRDEGAYRYCLRYFSKSDAIEDMALVRDYEYAKRIFPHFGGSACLVVLPDLPKGTVILGFYPLRVEYRVLS
jgi:hypothetical protein